MNIPAIRGNIGDWIYYVTVLTFDQVNTFVSRVDDELHTSENLRDMIQRSISSNFLNIKKYILNQPELFFDSLVLAVYNEYPTWREIEINFEQEAFFSLGILEFPGKHKIFPVDGQHRVEGIKAALKENSKLGTQKIAAIFIGHKNDENGMKRTRRLFSTLNRYAKPVTMDDIIALDEDDSVAIITRNLLEEFELFQGMRITKSGNKAISDQDKKAFTSIITLYQCNKELLKYFRKKRKNETPDDIRDKKNMEEYLKFRPSEKEIQLFEDYCKSYWLAFLQIDEINEYLTNENDNAAAAYRNRENGGNLLFRPVALLPFVQATLEIGKRNNIEFASLMRNMNLLELKIMEVPWSMVVWNPFEKTMIMGNNLLVKLLLIYMYGDTITPFELKTLKEKYAARLNRKNSSNLLSKINVLVDDN